MMNPYCIIPMLLLLSTWSIAQQTPAANDSVRTLDELTIKAYAAQRPLHQVSAAIGFVDSKDLSRFSNVSVVSAVNTVAGVRMEERSPGSYRLSVRGSSLRAPFGVRNVKVYWNQLPLTDPGGNTYLNQLDAGSINQLEIIKGPGSSLYGAGTGGVVLMESLYPRNERSVSLATLSGSYGLQSLQIALRDGDDNSSHHVQYLHQQSDGYRQQTRMVRDAVNSTFRFDLADHQVLEAVLLFSDLYYQTPGALTETEMNTNPKLARPTVGASLGAIDQNAGVSLRSFYSGISHEYQFTKNLHNRTGVYGNFVQFQNPAIRNYERRLEQNFGARSVTDFSAQIGETKLTLLGGGEMQHGYSPIKTYQNLQGFPGVLQSDDEVRTFTYSLFGQGEISYQSWILTGGLSINGLNYTVTQLRTIPTNEQSKKYHPVVTPRAAVTKKLNDQFSVYSNISFGYAPPTLAEVRPSTGEINVDLKPEKGTQLEIGSKGFLKNRTIQLDVALYHFALDETIVVRRAADGADYFVNAGSTRQNGAEVSSAWMSKLGGSSKLKTFKLWTSITLTDYTFKNYYKNDVSYSGNRLTGTPRDIFTGGIDLETKDHAYFHLTFNHTTKLPLDDANSVYANAYTLLGARAGHYVTRKKWKTEVYAGIDNLLDQRYSLGNDLNAIGSRYFNPAPARNYYFGVKVQVGRRLIGTYHLQNPD